MAEDKHRHHLFGRRHKEEEVEERISDDVEFKGGSHGFAGGDYSSENIGGDYSQIIEENIEGNEKKKKEHKHNEHLGEIDALADDDDDIDLYEKVDAKKDSEHGHKHKIEEEVTTIRGVGSAGCASCHERHEKKEAKEDEGEEEEEEEVEVKKKTNHLF